MTPHRSSPSGRGAALVGAALAAAVLAVPSLAGAATPQGIDPAIYATGVPVGTVEHGVVDVHTSGTPHPRHLRTEYWAMSDRWRSQTVDGDSGVALSEAMSTASQSVYLADAGAPATLPRVSIFDGPSTPPYAGWTAAYNKGLVDRGLLAPVGPATVAGIAGTEYTVPQDRKSTKPDSSGDSWVTDDTSASTDIVLENGTYAPLVRQTSTDNGQYGTFVQREELISRDRTPATAASTARLTRAASQRTLKRWQLAVRVAKARGAAARRRHARHHG